ncbi:hypothetical protein EJ06DRAFT_192148 [Trichodelitschia bisporula]|uniref:Uncharacterized protein n=1 Tax=Trichodelitschia bisporula TaxID=703511 RepID=A0A6G1I7E0_9PEZI|nr:hypothetical protein EJ06DRAFT_192148 [Trichodelitschia bisporula]
MHRWHLRRPAAGKEEVDEDFTSYIYDMYPHVEAAEATAASDGGGVLHASPISCCAASLFSPARGCSVELLTYLLLVVPERRESFAALLRPGQLHELGAACPLSENSRKFPRRRRRLAVGCCSETGKPLLRACRFILWATSISPFVGCHVIITPIHLEAMHLFTISRSSSWTR